MRKKKPPPDKSQIPIEIDLLQFPAKYVKASKVEYLGGKIDMSQFSTKYTQFARVTYPRGSIDWETRQRIPEYRFHFIRGYEVSTAEAGKILSAVEKMVGKN